MPGPEHIHIITAGSDIFPAYVQALQDPSPVTRTIIFTDAEFYSISSRDDPAVRARKESTRHSVSRVTAHAAALKIPVSFVFVTPPAANSTRDAVLKIREEHPAAVLSFDLTGGSKDLCMALFFLSLWVGGKTRYAFAGPAGEAVRADFAMPKIPVATVAANPNYVRVLETLARRPEKALQDPATGISRSYLYSQVAGCYVPVRKKGVNATKDPLGRTNTITGRPVELHELTQGTFSNILNSMVAADLIEECTGPEAYRKRSWYRITPSGELALRLAQVQTRQPHVT